MAAHEADLKRSLFAAYPCVPFTAKKQAKELFDKLNVFHKETDTAAWLDKMPPRVLDAFVNFYCSKHLDGVSVRGLEDLRDASVGLLARIKAFIALHAVEIKSTTSDESPIRKPENVHSERDATHKRVCFVEENQPKTSILLLLVGLPGSGKSTFSHAVIKAAGMEVIRLCQDEIGKSACEQETHAHLSSVTGKSVIIDRTNLSPDQRRIWLDIAKRYHARVIAIDFDVPEDICINRAKLRTDHATLDGSKATMVIKRLANTMKPVDLDEGIHQIIRRSQYTDDEALIREVIGIIGKS